MTFENDKSCSELEQIREQTLENLAALDALQKTRDAEWLEWPNLTEIRGKSLEVLDALGKIGGRIEKE